MPVGIGILISSFVTVMMVVFTTFIDSQFESNRCDALEKRININLAYTYNTGCVPVEDL